MVWYGPEWNGVVGLVMVLYVVLWFGNVDCGGIIWCGIVCCVVVW